MEKPSTLELQQLPQELMLLLAFMKLSDDETGFKYHQELFADVNWGRFLQLAMHHRVYPLLYTRLKNADERWIPLRVIQTLHQEYRRNTLQMLKLSAEMDHISKQLSAHNIRSLQLKGPVLAADLYGDISLRTSVDLDILIPIKRLDDAEELLKKSGYIKHEYIQTIMNDWKWRHHHLDFYHPEKHIKLELHWRLNPGPGKEPGFEELWSRRRVSSLTSHPIHFLGKEDLFFFLVSHGARHGWSRLRWLVDIDRLSKQITNWKNLRLLLEKYQNTQTGGQALLLTSELLHTKLNEESITLTGGNRPKRLAQDTLFYLQQMVNLHSDPVPRIVASYHKRYLFSIMSFQQKIWFMLSILHPYPKDSEILALPRKLHFLYFPLRPFLWTWRKVIKRS
jgi:hypothetical protein